MFNNKAIHVKIKIFVMTLVSFFLLSGCELDDKPDSSHVSVIPTPQELEWWYARHEQKLIESQNNPAVDVVLIGDSIIHNWENMGLSLWDPNPKGYSELNLGFAGDRTEHVLWRIENGELDHLNPKAIILLVGTNNTGHRSDPAIQTSYAIGKVVYAILNKLPETKIVLTALLPREEFPDAPNRLLNDDINSLISLAEIHPSVYISDINHLFLEEDGRLRMDLMPDGLHPAYLAYLSWREELTPLLSDILTN